MSLLAQLIVQARRRVAPSLVGQPSGSGWLLQPMSSTACPQQPQIPCHVHHMHGLASGQACERRCEDQVHKLTFSTQATESSQGQAGPASVGNESIEQIRARIFGEPIQPDERTGRRVLARPLQGAQLASWYFMPPRVPGTHNEEREYVLRRKLNKRRKKAEEEESGSGGKGKKK